MPMSDACAPLARSVGAALVTWLCLVAAWPVVAEDHQPFGSEFYSFVPPPPRAEAPHRPAVPAWRSDMQKAKKAYRQRNYPEARQHLEAALDSGNVLAAWYLGHLARLGLGEPADPAKAFKYYRQVAMGYDPQEPRPGALDVMVDSLVRVGDYYRDGDQATGIVQDANRAYRLYSTAAGHGHPGAQFGLGTMYLKGIGVRQNPGQAVRWLMLAARKRYPAAEALLGDLYWEGTAVPRDRSRAIMWYVLASQSVQPQSHPRIFDRLEVMLSEASEVERASGQRSAELWADRFPEDAPDLVKSGAD